MVVRVTARTTERLRCAVCHGEGALPELVQCGDCATSCHADCLAAIEGCPSLACPRSKPRPARPTVGAAPAEEFLLDEEGVAEAFRVVRDVALDVARFLLAVGGRLLGVLVGLTLLLAALTVVVQLLR